MTFSSDLMCDKKLKVINSCGGGEEELITFNILLRTKAKPYKNLEVIDFLPQYSFKNPGIEKCSSHT